MTLYGEQEGEHLKEDRFHKNRRAWNAWVGQALNAEARKAAAVSSFVDVAELAAWGDIGEKIEARFKTEFQRRSGVPAEAIFMPDPTDDINMDNITFATAFVMSKMVAASPCSFGSTNFQGASFQNTTFMQSAYFNGTTFTCGANFDYATFMQGAHFDSVIFKHRASFNKATFSQGGIFLSATFTGAADFKATNFIWGASFGSAEFKMDANFDSAIFRDFVYFSEAKFGVEDPTKWCRPVFKDCQFEKPTSFRAAVFCDDYPDFSGAVLHDKTTFTAKLEHWPVTTKQTSEQAKDCCAIIRHAVAKQGLPEEEHFFFRREMQFAGQIDFGWQRLPYKIFGWFSDYGHSIARPAFWLPVIWAFGFACFWGYFASCCVPHPNLVMDHPMGTAMALSFSNLFPLFGFGRTIPTEVLDGLPTSLAVLSGLQTVISLPLLFFLGLGLRQRFRLR
ncbi:MAG: pentapeptide repeat-containing protein [Rhodobacteraceae bacterium]|nr:pentapeptide repeat-containing protein [Paracoccaceae bacterium]